MSILRDLANRIREQRDAIAHLTADLIRVPTENPPGRQYAAAVDVLVSALVGLGLPAERVPLGRELEAVTCAVGKGPTLYFHGHYDVVPATAEGQFDPHVRDGRIWGRGSADMKGALSSMIHALAALRGTGHGTRVELVLVPGEETGGSDGMARLSEAGFIDDGAVGAVLGEPTSGVIWNGSRGALTGRVRVRGRSAHVGLHYEGANAFEAAVPILNGLLTLKAEVAGRVTALSIEPESARQSILMLGGEVRGGHQFNLVPDGFEFSVERRFNPEEDMEAERSRLEEVVRTSAPPGVSADLEIFQEAPASSVSASDPLVVGLADAIAGVTGARPPVELCPGLLESRFYASRGVPAVAYGPGELEVSHGPEESVELDRLVECAVIYAHLAHAWGGEG
ncbi:MAG: M20/M25/M40 family metallo-hydrolase [Gemmatimonadetes bacterium]|nr:M20/M25/M40 family metallo-hydrolase [Gemmatimonadota bacterium]